MNSKGFARFGLERLSKGGSVFGISYFRENRLEVAFLERTGDQYQLLGREQISLSQPASQQTMSDVHNRLSKYRVRSPVWIHVVLRHAAFVKLFSLSGVSSDELDAAVAKRIRGEIPYLAEELSYHYTTQGVRESESSVAMFGISKAVLKDHLEQLDRLGMIPEHILLSTEVLLWLYQTQALPQKREFQSVLLIHLFPRQAELLYLESGRILQSRWVSQEENDTGMLGEAIEAATQAFHRESKWKPKAALVFAENNEEVSASLSNFSIPVHFVSPWPHLLLPPLVVASAEAGRSGGVLDFTLPETAQKRAREATASGLGKLFFSIFCLALSIFLFAAGRTLIPFGETTWIQIRSGALNRSAREVKQLRTQALQIKEFRENKTSPVLLLAGLRRAIPAGVLLRELDYRGAQASFFARGVALQQALVEQFTQAVSREPGFYKVTLERVQSEQDARGGNVYSFEIKGFLHEDAGA